MYSMAFRFTLLVLVLLVIFNTLVLGEQPMQNYEIGIDEKLGEYIPLDLSFYDENGKLISLRKLINKPTIISLVYFHCPSICHPLLSGLAEALERLKLEPGKDYSVLTISFDDKDTSIESSQNKNNYIKTLKKPFPEDAWRFLTGDKSNIIKLTDAVGFKFKKEEDGFFSHTAVLITISPQGRIIRYLYGVTFLPFDLQMAITESASERIGYTAKKILLYCFSYNPKGKKYIFNILKVSGTLILFFVVLFFIYLTVKSKIQNNKSKS